MPDPAPMNPAADKQKYIDAAKKVYQALKLVFSGGDFWICGHAFDTVVDYFQNVPGATDKDEANIFAKVAIAGYKPISDAWYDDFSWWGIACLKAATAKTSAAPAPVFSAENQIVFRKIALQAWLGMAPAPLGWILCEDKAIRDKYEPLFDGGVWNHILTAQYHPGGSDGFGGRQNTVTNLGYLVLATRLLLERGPSSNVFKAAMEFEYEFLQQWRGFKEEKYKLERAVGIVNPPPYVARERIGRFKNGDSDPYYNPNWVWTGDQGLLLGALVDRMRSLGQGGPGYADLLLRARKLLEGSQDYVVKDKILRPWAPTDPVEGYKKDYWNGPAVYMRYLLWAFQHNADLKSDLQKEPLQAFLSHNADEVVNHPDRPQSKEALVNLTNNLAILVAAIAMLK